MVDLRYGLNSMVHLDLATATRAELCGVPSGDPVDDAEAAVTAALQQPVDYPPLAQTAMPGDRVVVALSPGIPQVAQVTAAVVRTLLASGVSADGITVLRTRQDVEDHLENPCRLVRGAGGEEIALVTHDPSERQGLAYLAATEKGDPILLNRLMTDADVVLPVGCLHSETTPGYFGINGGIFPTYADHRTQARYLHHSASQINGHRDYHLQQEVDQVAWLLGITFTVQIVPAAGEGILHVLAGEADAVRRQAHQRYRAAWGSSVPDRASLVVCGMPGDAAQQTWENFGRTLAAALALCDEDGAIAVCCELSGELPAAVRCLSTAPSRESALRQIRKERLAESLPAAQLARALEHGRVYLLSQLDPTALEELDVVPLADAAELVRLTAQHKSCIVLCNAPRAVVTVGEQ
jgi:nickel-dependent lactate racemase